MADYNIYIHSDGASGVGGVGQTFGQNSPTTPWNVETKSNSAIPQMVQNAASVAANPDGLVSYGVMAFAKAVPWIAAAYAVLKIAEQTYATAVNYYTATTGDYRRNVGFSNFETYKSWVLQPFSTAFNHFKTVIEVENENARRFEQRQLLGDSIINSYSNRGV